MADADEDAYMFNAAGVRRIVKSTRWTEGQSKQPAPPAVPRLGSGGKDVRSVINGSGEAISPNYLVAITSPSVAQAAGSDFFAVTARATKPSTTYTKQYGIVVGLPAENEEHTHASFDGGLVTYQGTQPTEGTRVGPVPGSFAVSSTAPPYFTVVGVSTQFSLCDVVPYQPATISPVTLASPLADGASADVTLSDGRVVNAQNVCGQLLASGNSLCVADPHSGMHYLTGSAAPSTAGGGSGPTTTVTVITNFQYNETTHRLEKKTRDITVVAATTESAWTTVRQLSETLVATDLLWSEHTLTWNLYPIWSLEVDSLYDLASIAFTQRTIIADVFDDTTALKQTPFQGYVVDPTTMADETIVAISTCAT